jgi:hypothetical protein
MRPTGPEHSSWTVSRSNSFCPAPSRSVPVSTRPSAAETVFEVPWRRAASAAVRVVTAAMQRTCPSAAVARTSVSPAPLFVSLVIFRSTSRPL